MRNRVVWESGGEDGLGEVTRTVPDVGVELNPADPKSSCEFQESGATLGVMLVPNPPTSTEVVYRELGRSAAMATEVWSLIWRLPCREVNCMPCGAKKGTVGEVGTSRPPL